MTKETVSLGFDLRLRATDYASKVWSPEHRGLYLLREDVEWPMSVDRSVWPSFLQSHYFDAKAHRVPNPRFVNQDTANLENDFGLLRDIMNLARLPGADLGVGIGVQVISQELERIELLLGIEADAIPAGATVLGFDVATATPISGLSNCGYDQNELPQLRSKWGSNLNEHGLMESLDDAFEFREMTNRRVPEHAPFYVYQLFEIALKIGADGRVAPVSA